MGGSSECLNVSGSKWAEREWDGVTTFTLMRIKGPVQAYMQPSARNLPSVSQWIRSLFLLVQDMETRGRRLVGHDAWGTKDNNSNQSGPPPELDAVLSQLDTKNSGRVSWKDFVAGVDADTGAFARCVILSGCGVGGVLGRCTYERYVPIR
jgi:hypothetical protein